MSMSIYKCPFCCKDTNFIKLYNLTPNYLPEEKTPSGGAFQHPANAESYACPECGYVFQKLSPESMNNLKKHLK